MMNSQEYENRLARIAEELATDTRLEPGVVATAVLGLLFLTFADNKYSRYEDEIETEYMTYLGSRSERTDYAIALSLCGLFIPPKARFRYLLRFPEGDELNTLLMTAMDAIEKYQPLLHGMLPREEYSLVSHRHPGAIRRLLEALSVIPTDAPCDLFETLYASFLEQWRAQGRQGDESLFPSPTVLSRMVAVLK